jgi:hypothetical protein
MLWSLLTESTNQPSSVKASWWRYLPKLSRLVRHFGRRALLIMNDALTRSASFPWKWRIAGVLSPDQLGCRNEAPLCPLLGPNSVPESRHWERSEKCHISLTSNAALRWGKRYPAIGHAWRRAWDYVVPFLAFAPGICKMIYTTNAVEALHRSLRKTIKTRGSFPMRAEAALPCHQECRLALAARHRMDNRHAPIRQPVRERFPGMAR